MQIVENIIKAKQLGAGPYVGSWYTQEIWLYEIDNMEKNDLYVLIRRIKIKNCLSYLYSAV